MRQLINSIFSDGPVRGFLQSQLAGPGAQYESLSQFMGQLRGFFAQNLATAMKDATIGGLDDDVIDQARRLARFEADFQKDSQRYQFQGKANPAAVFWPNPDHPRQPISLHDTLPMIENLGLIDKATPIGSAGSCFAAEIAYYLQDHGYNYVVTEFDEKDGPKPEASARWGIIFNTPSIKQLAEKAFGERTMPKLIEHHAGGNYWQDPFRENIPYLSIDELEADRKRHILACRKALETCKVFFITLGLNECWEYRPDGAVASRSPKSMLHYALFRHRVLSVDENVAELQRFLDVVRAHNPEMTLIVTVSPVPFMATGLGDESHVIAANAHSKAVLRAAAETFVRANERVHYFPSYEMVMHCLEDPWESDQRHVRRDAVEKIMKLFEKTYVIDAGGPS
ncbi:MAG: GSCFA domain-containing protein [Magnetovibrio sp.]|nr:GSCFA domain-containing protein [Magnetovibrio sp.]